MTMTAISMADVAEAFKLNYLLGSAVENICLHEERNGEEDLKQALDLLKREIENQEKGQAEAPLKTATDNINPSHYKTTAGFQVIDVIDMHGLNFSLGNAVKYICRHASKNGLEDLKKAAWYLSHELEG